MSGTREEPAAEGAVARDGAGQRPPQPIAAEQQAMIGRQVTVTVGHRNIANDVAFWTEVGGQRLLVVMNRDVRNAAQRQQGRPSAHRIVVPESGPVILTGTVEQLPAAEHMFSWGLTSRDRAEVTRLGVYLRVASVGAGAATGS